MRRSVLLAAVIIALSTPALAFHASGGGRGGYESGWGDRHGRFNNFYGRGFGNRLPGYLGPTWGFGYSPDPCQAWDSYSGQWYWAC